MAARWRDLKRSTWIVAIVVVGALAPTDAEQIIQAPARYKIAYTQYYTQYYDCNCVCGDAGCICDAFCPFPTAGQFIVEPVWQTAGPDGSWAPTWSPDATRIAFVSDRDIVVMDAQGSTPVNLTNSAATEGPPAWSPDGQRIAFASDRDGPVALYLMNPDGSNVVRVTAGVGVSLSRATWSPDSARIAFDCEVNTGNLDICSIDSDGTGFLRLTDDPGPDVGPAWSPDGGTIAFATNRYGTHLQLALMNVDGSGVSQLGGGITGWDPAWSPDGSRLAFVSYGFEWDAIYVMRADGSDIEFFTEPAASPAWMPGPVIATFGVDCSGLVCSVDGSSSLGNITSYAWDFGDGTTATAAAVSHTYIDGGSRSVTLTVTDTNGASATEVRTFYLNHPPVASFTVSCELLTCIFDWSGSYDPEGYGLTFGWDFGDGTTGFQCCSPTVVLHTYAAPGSYTATLRVTDNLGATTTTSRTITLATPFMHVGDIDVAKTTQPGLWSATVTISVHDSAHRPRANAVVNAVWSTGAADSCTTSAAGTCVLRASQIRPKATLGLTVINVTHGVFVYAPASNHDPDGDSDGTRISFSK